MYRAQSGRIFTYGAGFGVGIGAATADCQPVVAATAEERPVGFAPRHKGWIYAGAKAAGRHLRAIYAEKDE